MFLTQRTPAAEHRGPFAAGWVQQYASIRHH